MGLVPTAWTHMANERGVQNVLALIHIALGLCTTVFGPVAFAGLVALLASTPVGVGVPVGTLVVRGVAVVVAGVGLTVAGHLASSTVQRRLFGDTVNRYDAILFLGWFWWAGALYVALGNAFGSA
jgi:hypothetical protein